MGKIDEIERDAAKKAIAASKQRAAKKARKSKVGTSFDPGVLEAFKAKAERVGIHVLQSFLFAP